jgi:holo-[acyl-carrier protein] synthase
MPIIGHGIDIVETARVKHLIDQHGQHFLDRVFTSAEQAYCDASKKRALEHYAGRFAAKEAVLKVLGTGWRGGIAWTDVEVTKDPSGQPQIALTGETARIAATRGITRWLISISHIETHATASAIGVTGEA